jgi:LytS/YehU family sensor histidine kinase
VATLLMSSLVIAIYEAISFYLQLQQAEAEKSELERQNVLSQLEGLRSQVNPHFLFNSLNTLIYLIPEDSDKAVRFVQQLSKVYRYVLESRDAKLIPLSEEIDFLNSYIFLQKERFGDNLQVQLRDIPDQSNFGIVPLSLQLLFENAIKHNIVSVEKPLLIEVFAEQDHLVIRNNLQRKNQVMDSTSVGLQNIIDRYKLLTDRVVNIIISDKYFTVALPIVHT